MVIYVLWLATLANAAWADSQLVVSVGDRLEVVNIDGTTVASRPGTLVRPLNPGAASKSSVASQLSANGGASLLTADPVSGLVLVADSRHQLGNASIYGVSLNPSWPPPTALVSGGGKRVQGVAFDPVDRIIYWTTGPDRKILKAGPLPYSHSSTFYQSSPTSVPQVDSSKPVTIHYFVDKVPHGLALDPCKRRLYWSNCNMSSPTIETSLLPLDNASQKDSSGEVTVLVSEDLFQPLGVTLFDGWLYWADERSANGFRLERINLKDLSKRELLVKGQHQQPFSLTVVHGSGLFWTDILQQALWTVPLTGGKPVMIHQYPDAAGPTGLVSIPSVDPASLTCPRMASIANTTWNMLWGHEKPTCPMYFCLNGGNCSAKGTVENPVPSCTCHRGYIGSRCQYSIRICAAFCLSSAAATDLNLFNTCRCNESLISRRLQESKLRHSADLFGSVEKYQTIEKDDWKKATLISLSVICCMLLLSVVFLSYKTFVLSKRPRLRRRYTVTKNLPAPRSGGGIGAVTSTSAGHCEIDIENCCNMNICETPCYEPDLRRDDSEIFTKSDEKRGLIACEASPSVMTPPVAALRRSAPDF